MLRTVIAGVIAGFIAVLATGAIAAPVAYDSPQAAVGAVVEALEARDRDGLIAIFGDEHEDVILTGNMERDRAHWGEFLTGYQAMHRIAEDADGGTAILHLGEEQWPFPVSLRKGDDGKWRFDAAAARDELLDRQIGENELDVMALMRGYNRVQAAYRQIDYDNDGVMEFAGAILSDPGERNGLYWPDEPGTPASPIGDFVARASANGYSVGQDAADPEPYLGYYYRVLARQGDAAPGGAREYMVGEDMVAGHALFAFPAAYGESGVMSFMIGENGILYEADLGEDTLERAAAIDAYDPGADWSPVE